jgi:hypothetical protein
MSKENTPGQLAYEAYWATLEPPVQPFWGHVPLAVQAAWEAAAQAVLTHSQTAQGVTLHTMLEFLIAYATPEDLNAVHLWLSEATASLHAEMQYYPEWEDR